MNSIMQSIIEGRGVRAERLGCPGWLIAAVALAIAAPALAGAAAAPAYFRMKKVEVVDAHSFEKPLTAATLLIPTNWSLESKVARDPKNNCPATQVRAGFRASSPDGRIAVELFPGAYWNWSDDPAARQHLEQGRRVRAQYGTKDCDIGPPLAARDFLSKYFLPRVRPGARLLGADVDPEAAQGVSNQVRQAEEQIAKAGAQVRLRADTARLHIAYDQQGQSQEEWLSGITFARGTPGSRFNPSTGQMGPALSYACGAQRLFGLSAPAGQLEANEKLFRAIVGSLHVNPDWQARVQQLQRNVQAARQQDEANAARINAQTQAIVQKGELDRARIRAQTAQNNANIVLDTMQHRQQAQDRNFEMWTR